MVRLIAITAWATALGEIIMDLIVATAQDDIEDHDYFR